jgi:hypothetical protein
MGNASASGLTMNGPLTFGFYGSAPVSRTWTSTANSASSSWYQLGTWYAPQSGRQIKLNVLACANGFNVNSSGNSVVLPSQFELDIFFQTSNGADHINNCLGFGWALSKHVYWAPEGVAVRFKPRDATDGASYTFFVRIKCFPGEWMVTSSSRYPWNGVMAGPFATIPLPLDTSAIPLWMSTCMHSYLASSSYLTVLNVQ